MSETKSNDPHIFVPSSTDHSPKVSFLSPPPPPRGSASSLSLSSSHASNLLSASRTHSGNRSSSRSAVHGSGGGSAPSHERPATRSGGSAARSIASANSAFSATPRRLDASSSSVTPGSVRSVGSAGTALRSASLRGGGGGIATGGSGVVNGSATPTSMMLLPPSQTISESLTSLASFTAAQLEEVWDEVGYSPDERASQLTDLLGSFRRLCDDKIAEERGVAETFRNEIVAAREEVRTTSRALRVDVDPSLLAENDGTHSLTDELAAIEVALEGLREDARVATADLGGCRDKLLAAHVALGTELEPEWEDVTSDLTRERRDAFNACVEEMEQIVATRTSATVQLLKDCQHLIRELRVDPAESKLDGQIMGSLVRDAESDEIVMTSTVESDECTGITARALDDLTERVAELNGEKRRRKVRLGEMGAEIAALWEKLRVPEEEQRAFAESVKGLGMDTIEKGEVELRRLHELKAGMIGRLIAEAREEIRRLWDETSANEEQRGGFQAAKVTDESLYTDELLAEHESYICYLQDRLEQMQPILRIIEKREDIIKERMEYEELQKDPTRLQQRGAALTKQLMREEKMARRIKRDLPKATDLLERKLHDWQKNNGEAFVYHGEVYLDVMKSQDEEWHRYKDNEMQIKLKKKQEEKAQASSRVSNDTGYYKPLPGKKKAIQIQPYRAGGGGGGPLSDAGSRTNRENGRAASRGRAGADAVKKGTTTVTAGKGRPISRGRATSRGRADLPR